MKKALSFILILLTLVGCIGTVAFAADFGSGVAVSASDVKVIKSGLFGKKITFSDLDIKQALCITNFEKITITKIPSSSEGTLMFGGRRISEGTSIKRKNIPSLVFIPASKDVSEAKFYFTVDGYADGAEIEFLIRFTDKINYEPEIVGDEQTSAPVSTQREIGVYSKMRAVDKEGDELEYIIVSYPKYGSIELLNKENGEYLYTPPYSFVGSDSFSYVCRDEWGNFSVVCTVNININERMSEVVFADMEGRPEYNASVAMTAMGIMNGRVLGDNTYFSPDDSVSKAEFVAMAMKAVGMKADTRLTTTFFDDNAEIPAPLVGYIATAQRLGYIHGAFANGKLLFRPNDAITKYEAGVIMASLLDAEGSGEVPVFNDATSIPTWARDAVYAMYSLGVFESEGDRINATDKVTRAECAEYLYRIAK